MKSHIPSGFISDTPESEDVICEKSFSDFSPLPPQAHAQLYKARRGGQWWMLKGLRENERQMPFYQHLLEKEYEILTQMSHPGVVKAVDFADIAPLGKCIVMEYVDGQPLSEMKGFDKRTRRRLARDIAETVAYVHKCQIVHRDLKPENIFVTHNGQHVKILDFGLADTDSHAVLKQPAGTKEYMAPEQRQSDTPDLRNDIYSLGCIFKEMDLGWSYNRLIRRMLKPIKNRTASAEQVLKEMDFARRLPTRIKIAFLICALFAVLTYMGVYTLSKVEEVKVVQDEAIQKELSLKELENEGKRQLDEMLARENFKTLTDSVFADGILVKDVDSPEYQHYRRVLGMSADSIEAFVDRQRGKLNAAEIRNLDMILNDYLSSMCH